MDVQVQLSQLGFHWEQQSLPEEGMGPLESRVAGVGYPSVKGVESSGQVQEEWEVVFPHQVVGKEWLDQAICMQEAASYRCKIASQDVSSVSLGPEELEAALVELKVAQGEREWWEALLVFAPEMEGLPSVVKSLITEVLLGEAEPVAAEQFLQTRTVGLDEARRELEAWVEPGMDEIQWLSR